MSDANREYLLEQFQLIEEYLRRARGIAGRSREEYLGDPNTVDASVRQLTVLFETCHNVAKHLISRNGWRTPASKADAFEVLAERRILPEELSLAFREAARFRNLVVYQTALLQEDIVYGILQDHLGDFDLFLTYIARWLDGSSPTP